jgi:tRNA pseudouridine38-40 synthase
LRRALNDELPADINVLDVQAVARRFHARHAAVGRRYLYQIATRRSAFAKPFVWWVKEPLNIQAMRDAARQFVGMRDFQSFAADEDETVERSTLVLIDRLDLVEAGDLVLIVVEGSHFLWKMVRRIVGVLVEIGRGELPISEAARLLSTKSNLPARLTAPASGLFLVRVYYPGEERTPEVTPVTPLNRAAR